MGRSVRYYRSFIGCRLLSTQLILFQKAARTASATQMICQINKEQTMLSKVRVGLVGIRNWAIGVHLHQLRSHPGAEVAAICGRDLNRAEQAAVQHGISRAFSDYREMIDKGDLEAIIISTPDN